jgi:U3 small nucleolar RNA-associated protein 13
VSADESQLVCLFDDDLKVVDIHTGERTNQLTDPSTESDEGGEIITCFCVHPNGTEVVVATQNFLLRHWKLDPTGTTGNTCLRAIRGHTMPVLCMTYDPTGTLVATGSADRTIRIWDVDRGYCTHNFREHTDIIRSVQFHPDADRLLLVSTSEDNSVRVFDLRDSACVGCFREHLSTPTAVSFSPDGYLMTSVGRDKVMNVYGLRTYNHIKTIPVMEELEGVVTLSADHAQIVLSPTSQPTKADKNPSKLKKAKPSSTVDATGRVEVVVVTAGMSGVLRLFRLSMVGKDVSTFAWEAIGCVPMHASVSTALGVGGSATSRQSSYSLTGLHYLSRRGQLAAVTADHNFCFFDIVGQAVTGLGSGLVGEQGALLAASRQLIGCNDDILDIIVIPRPTDTAPATTTTTASSSSSSNKRRSSSVGSDTPASASATHPDPSDHFHLALITNSPQVRLVDGAFACTPLDGHTDIVLAADVSPDG